MLSAQALRKERSCLCLFFLLVFSWLPVSAMAFEEEKPAADRPLGSLEKSLIIPGWGQLAEKRYIEGVAFLSAEIFCLVKIISNNHQGNENYALYQRSTATEDAVHYRQLTEKYDTRRNQFILAAAAVWAVNLIDIYLIVNAKGKKERSLELKVERGENKTLSLALAYRF